MASAIDVTFMPEGRTVAGRRGDTLLDVAADHGVDLPHTCGGNCSCTSCHVVVEAADGTISPMEAPERERLETDPRREGRSRLACQTLLLSGPVTVWVLGERPDEWAL